MALLSFAVGTIERGPALVCRSQCLSGTGQADRSRFAHGESPVAGLSGVDFKDPAAQTRASKSRHYAIELATFILKRTMA